MVCHDCAKTGLVSFLKKAKESGVAFEAPLLFCPECGNEEKDNGMVTDYDVYLEER